MLELYHLENLERPYAKVPVISGRISAERNGYYQFSFSLLNHYLESHHMIINQKTVFKVNGLFYCCTECGNSDTEKIMKNYKGELLQTQILMFRYIAKMDLKSTSLLEVLTVLLDGTLLEVGACDAISGFDFTVENNNAQYGLDQLLKLTDTEVAYEGLRINIKRRLVNGEKILIKGKDFNTLEEQTDISEVVTKLYYQSTDEKLSGVIESEFIGDYAVVREGYKAFEADNKMALLSMAQAYLATIDQPVCSISISIPKIRRLSLELCEWIQIHNTLLDKTVTYQVVGYQKSLTNQDDTYQLGQRKKDFTDIEDILEEKTEKIAKNMIIEVMEHEVISANTAHILNAWIHDLNVEFLETNFDALDSRKAYPEGGIRNFIRIQEEQLEFVTQTLNAVETEDYINKDGQQIYYTAIEDNPQAYKYFTITSPTSMAPDLSEEDIEKFKVKIRKVESESIKAAFEFGKIDDTQYPLMRWGIGTDKTGKTENGKGFMYKELDGLVLKYITSSGIVHQIKLGENGIEGIPQQTGGLISIPGQALTDAQFFSNGVTFKHGILETTFLWEKDSNGRITKLTNLSNNTAVTINWSASNIEGGMS